MPSPKIEQLARRLERIERRIEEMKRQDELFGLFKKKPTKELKKNVYDTLKTQFASPVFVAGRLSVESAWPMVAIALKSGDYYEVWIRNGGGDNKDTVEVQVFRGKNVPNEKSLWKGRPVYTKKRIPLDVKAITREVITQANKILDSDDAVRIRVHDPAYWDPATLPQ